jgi:hypothetical protein
MNKCCLIEDNKYYFMPYGGGCEITCHKCGYKLFGRTYNSAQKRWAMEARKMSFSYRARRFFSLFFSVLVLASLACGTQLPSVPSTEVKQPTSEAQPVQVAAIAEPTESPVIYVTTAPLNVRAQANASSQILGTLEAGTIIVIFIPIPEIKGDDCYLGEWYETKWNEVTAYVCSLYVKEQ